MDQALRSSLSLLGLWVDYTDKGAKKRQSPLDCRGFACGACSVLHSRLQSTDKGQTMLHIKDKDVLTRTQALMLALGWQGGTVHQLASDLGLDAYEIIYADALEYSQDHRNGWFAYRTNSLEFNQRLKVSEKGNLQFWLGVAGGVQTTIKLGEKAQKKF